MKRFTFILLALTGCDQVERLELDDDSGSGSAIPQPVQQRLTDSCALAGCHVAGAVAPDLSEGSGGAWLGQTGAGGPYVSFGDVDNSYLIEKLMPSPSSGSQMPLAPGVLEPEDRAVIVGWVAGAEFPEEAEEEAGESTGGMPDDPTTGGSSDASGGNADVVSCSLDVVAPDVASPVIAGDEAGVIPSSIGGALEKNCGCHYTSETSDPALYFPYGGATQIAALEDFTGDYAGGNPAYMGSPAWQAVEDRVIVQANMPMAVCEVEGGGTMSEADYALFEAWFEQEVPDGAAFVPPS